MDNKPPKGVGFQTHWMILGAGENIYITSGQDKETGKHHGFVDGRHDTPSGNERWQTIVSDNKGYDTHEIACKELKKKLPKEYQFIEILKGEENT